MTSTELEMVLQGYSIAISTLTQEIQALRIDIQKQKRIDNLPDWINLKTAVSLKGGAAFPTYRSKLFLQPCCGRNYQFLGGVKCWRREDVLDWLAIADSGLKAYAENWHVSIPENYERRSA
ncbi:MAG: hypothetical protein LBT95_02105 [Treponema sp.]|jgi:hypothetical protein|nr:hypothetical protein [Treponema sp.]